MSDFLDRLAARAIGSEATLAPRLPSLFEPLQRAPIMPFSGDGETSPGRSETVSSATVPPAVPLYAPSAPVVAMADASRVAPAAVDALAAPAHAAASTPRRTPPQAPIAAPAPSPVVGRAQASPNPSRPAEAFVSRPVQPRQTHIATEQPEPVASSHPPQGVLLPAPTPVFSATDAAGRAIHVAATRALAAPTGTGSPSSEPVVHVSIGRLEVRAAPASVTPPRRRDGPQPGTLDDYLRQRAKASP